jgi:transposase
MRQKWYLLPAAAPVSVPPRFGASPPKGQKSLTLSPYAPELNPMKNVWDYLRGNQLGGLIWDSYEAMLEACKRFGCSWSTTQNASSQ